MPLCLHLGAEGSSATCFHQIADVHGLRHGHKARGFDDLVKC